MVAALVLFVITMSKTHLENVQYDISWRIQAERAEAKEAALLELGIEQYLYDYDGGTRLTGIYTEEYSEWWEDFGRKLEVEIEQNHFVKENLTYIFLSMGWSTRPMLYFFVVGLVLYLCAKKE